MWWAGIPRASGYDRWIFAGSTTIFWSHQQSSQSSNARDRLAPEGAPLFSTVDPCTLIRCNPIFSLVRSERWSKPIGSKARGKFHSWNRSFAEDVPRSYLWLRLRNIWRGAGDQKLAAISSSGAHTHAFHLNLFDRCFPPQVGLL